MVFVILLGASVFSLVFRGLGEIPGGREHHGGRFAPGQQMEQNRDPRQNQPGQGAFPSRPHSKSRWGTRETHEGIVHRAGRRRRSRVEVIELRTGGPAPSAGAGKG